MLLQTDDQTIRDLRLFAAQDQPGIYDIYNNTFTRGGEQLLEHLFRQPLCNREAIAKRAAIIAGFNRAAATFPFDAAVLDHVEKYIGYVDQKGHDATQQLHEKDIQNGIMSIVELFHQLRDFLEKGSIASIGELQAECSTMKQLLAGEALQPVFNEKPGARLSFAAVTAFDVLLRTREKDVVRSVLQFIYTIDVYISVAQIAQQRHFVFPVVHPKGTALLRLKGLYHPELKKPVANDFGMDGSRNVEFLTGANMAGKSTFLRAVSTAVYIAHLGFPVAATAMEFSVMDGIYTAINLPDNLGIGASHFYAEVLQVKKVAAELRAGKSLFVVFDELFRGTNVKDAMEGTVAITRAFAGKSTSLFIISSHIVEAGESLRTHATIGFHYLPTRMNGHVPEYSYTLQEGITEDRHGMIIIRNEGILDILKNGKKSIV
jgi:DNA mismatch repair protein MutS